MRRHLLLIFASFICLSLLSAMAAGQSGRKQKKAESQPPVQGVNQPEARVQPEPEATAQKPKEEKDQRSIMVATGMSDVAIPLYYVDTARQACLSELRNALKSIDLREARNQNRSEAVKIAKQEDRTYVVLMELELDRMGSSSTGVDLRYTIFEPKTGKVVGTGSGNPVQPGGISAPPIGGSRDQVYLDWMGRDVARQVMKRLRLVP